MQMPLSPSSVISYIYAIYLIFLKQNFLSVDNRLEMEITDFYEETKVKFSELSEELLWEYIHSGEPM